MLKLIWVSFTLLERRERRIFGGLTAFRVLTHLMDVLGLIALGTLGAAAVSSSISDRPVEFFGMFLSVDRENVLLVGFLIITIFFFGKSALAAYSLRLTTRFLGRAEADTAARLAEKLFAGGLARLGTLSRGEVQWATVQSSNVAFSTVLFAGATLVTETALFLIIFGLFLVVDPLTATLLLAYFSLIFIVFKKLVNSPLKNLGQNLAHHSVEMNDAILDLYGAFREASVANRLDYFLERFFFSRRVFASELSRQRFYFAIPRHFVESALMLGVASLAVWQFSVNSLQEGLVSLGIFIIGGLRMMAAILPMQNALIELRGAAPQAERAYELIKMYAPPSSQTPKSNSQSSSKTNSVKDVPLSISASNLTFTYPSSVSPAIRNISFEIKPGESVGLAGVSGSGKSTLADLILGLREPDSGRVSIAKLSPTDIREVRDGLISYVPQRVELVAGGIEQNIALGVPKNEIDRGKVLSLVRDLDLQDLVDELPDGISSNLGKNSDGLSGGQLQRIGIARALYTNPRLLVLDESTSALDSKTEKMITELVDGLEENCTVITIAHRLSTLRKCDVIFFLDHGEIADSGTFDEVQKKNSAFRELTKLLSLPQA